MKIYKLKSIKVKALDYYKLGFRLFFKENYFPKGDGNKFNLYYKAV